MSDPDMAVGYDWVMDMREKYPSFTLPAALLLKRSPDTITAQQRKELVSWLALAATDREAILAMFDPTEQECCLILEPIWNQFCAARPKKFPHSSFMKPL